MTTTLTMTDEQERVEVGVALAQWLGDLEWRARPGNRQATAAQRLQYEQRAAVLRRLIEREGI